MAISKEIRQQVRERAKYLCEYCHSSAVGIHRPMTPLNPDVALARKIAPQEDVVLVVQEAIF